MTKHIRTISLVFFLALSTSAFAKVDAQLIYEDYFGDYFVGSSFQIEIDLETDSVLYLRNKLKQLYQAEGRANGFDTNVLLVGYGKEDSVESYFAATRNLNSERPLGRLLPNIPTAIERGGFFIRFVNPNYSSYLDPSKPAHHWASPFGHLNQIGKRVVYF